MEEYTDRFIHSMSILRRKQRFEKNGSRASRRMKPARSLFLDFNRTSRAKLKLLGAFYSVGGSGKRRKKQKRIGVKNRLLMVHVHKASKVSTT